MFIFLAIIGGALMLPLRWKFGDLILTFASIASGVIAWVVFIFAIDIWIYVVYLVFLVFFQAVLFYLVVKSFFLKECHFIITCFKNVGGKIDNGCLLSWYRRDKYKVEIFCGSHSRKYMHQDGDVGYCPCLTTIFKIFGTFSSMCRNDGKPSDMPIMKLLPGAASSSISRVFFRTALPP